MFDPSELTVKKAVSKLKGLSLTDLEAVLAAEIDGKHRSSLIAGIGQAIDALKTSEEDKAEEAPLVVAAAPVPVVPAKRRISQSEWFRLSRRSKRSWMICADGSFEEI